MGALRARKMQVSPIVGSSYVLGPPFFEDNELRCLVGKMAACYEQGGGENVSLTESSKAVTIKIHSHIPPSFISSDFRPRPAT